MKKKNLKKLSLNKDAVSNLDGISGGLKADSPIPASTVSACATACVTNCGNTCPGWACVATYIFIC